MAFDIVRKNVRSVIICLRPLFQRKSPVVRTEKVLIKMPERKKKKYDT